MKLLVVGSGGREHAIAKKLLESKDVEQVFVAPGNDGMTLDGLDLINIGISEHSNLIDFAKANDIAWTFIGPDDALAAGIVDDFNAAGLKAFGPTKAAAELEWSKDFAKEIMVKYDVPTAAYSTFSDFEEAKAYIEEKALQSSSRQTVWPLEKVLSLLKRLSKPSKLLTRCFWTINSVIQVRVWSSRNSLTGKSSLSLPLSMGTSSTSCQRLRTTNVLMMGTRALTLVGWVPMRRFLTCHRAWLTQRLTLLSSQFLKA